MSQTSKQEQLRLEIAEVLDSIAAQPGWSDELWSHFHALLEHAEIDGILAHADEELGHYSGVFNPRNLIRVKPDKAQVSSHKAEFRQLADAIRSHTTWDEYKRANRIYEARDLSNALKRFVERVGRLLKRTK
ncbi:MAG: hypothetical protein ACLQMT_00270 [Candidatus Acidiferrales bacterium]